MINYPYGKLLKSYFLSKTKRKLKITDESILEFRAGIFDIDPYCEINNGRYHILGDIGRFDHGFRTGFFKRAIKYKLSFMVAGSTAKYRFRIKYGEKFQMSTKIIYTDEKWVYYITNFFSRDQLKSSVLTRTGTIKGGKLLRPAEASEFFGHQVPEYDLPDWIALWIESDNTYPGF